MQADPSISFPPVRERWIATGSLLLGMVSFTIALMVANVVLPEIMTSLRADLDQAQWILTGAGIAQTVIMPLVGWLTSLVGHRSLYLGSLLLFCVGSVCSGLAWSIESLIFFQIVSGLGVGLMQPLITVIMYQIFPPKQRGLALGLSMVGWSFGPAIGPILGGYLIEAFNWRAGFYVSVPLGLAGFVAALVYLPSLPRPARKTMDQVGLLTMTVALVTLLMALTQGRREGWDSTYIVTLFVIAAVATVLFLVYEWQSVSPLVDLRLFRCCAVYPWLPRRVHQYVRLSRHGRDHYCFSATGAPVYAARCRLALAGRQHCLWHCRGGGRSHGGYHEPQCAGRGRARDICRGLFLVCRRERDGHCWHAHLPARPALNVVWRGGFSQQFECYASAIR